MTSFVRDEVEAARGLSGAVLRASWETVERFRPGVLERVVEELSPRLAEALEPIYQEAVRSSATLEAAFEARADELARAAIGVAHGAFAVDEEHAVGAAGGELAQHGLVLGATRRAVVARARAFAVAAA